VLNTTPSSAPALLAHGACEHHQDAGPHAQRGQETQDAADTTWLRIVHVGSPLLPNTKLSSGGR
jgi:hypothetical protein